ncbi:hypothetical protein V6O07_04605 [Arthrospira platensis SPKY2]
MSDTKFSSQDDNSILDIQEGKNTLENITDYNSSKELNNKFNDEPSEFEMKDSQDEIKTRKSKRYRRNIFEIPKD